MSEETKAPKHFIEQIIEEDIANGKHDGALYTRFPPEPSGYLHLGHAKPICLNFGLAKQYNGKTNLRFDDTNPTLESVEYVEAIKKDIQWLGYQWEGEPLYASDYFDHLYAFAIDLIKKGLAYVDDSSAEDIAEMKGTPTKPGVLSPFAARSIEENLDLFVKMKEGEFPDGSKVLRARVDMSSPNMHMRDPILYRIKREHHHRTGDKWLIYPMYDFAHGQSDSLERITHSLCSLEFRHHRPLYDWFIDKLEIFPSRQIEFARMNVTYMVTSKRKLREMVQKGLVSGWDDPRMSTISGLRRKGYPASAIRLFCEKAGVAKRENWIEIELLEACVRGELNKSADRMMAVLDPIKLVITNYPGGQSEALKAVNNPEEENPQVRELMFSKELYIERGDFMEDPPKKFFRLGPGRNVRLKNAYIIHCEGFDKDETGKLTQIRCRYYPDSKSGEDVSGIKAKGTLHWVSCAHAIDAEIRDYDRLFTVENPLKDPDKSHLDFYNKESLQINSRAKLEPYLAKAEVNKAVQFMRMGYYSLDPDSTTDKLIFNKTVGLKSSWKPK